MPKYLSIKMTVPSGSRSASMLAWLNKLLAPHKMEVTFCEEAESLDPSTAWQQLVEVDDRTSPAEYPDHCLITKDELESFMLKGTIS